MIHDLVPVHDANGVGACAAFEFDTDNDLIIRYVSGSLRGREVRLALIFPWAIEWGDRVDRGVPEDIIERGRTLKIRWVDLSTARLSMHGQLGPEGRPAKLVSTIVCDLAESLVSKGAGFRDLRDIPFGVRLTVLEAKEPDFYIGSGIDGWSW